MLSKSQEIQNLYTLNTQFDPYQHIYASSFRHMSCRKAVSLLASNVLVLEEPVTERMIDDFKIYTQIHPNKQGLEINFGPKFLNYAIALDKELKLIGFQHSSVDTSGIFQISSASDNETKAVHDEIGRFIVYVCQTWKINSHSYIRDLYCSDTGKEIGIKNITEETKTGLQKIFNECHWMHSAVSLTQNLVSKIKGWSNVRAKYDKVDPSSYYQRYNLIAHSFHFGNSSQPQSSNNNKAEKKSSDESKFVLINNGDLFKEISELSPDDKTVLYSANNSFRPGGGLLIGSHGSIEEMICRISNYLPALAQHLDANDPLRKVIEGVFVHTKPTSRKITIKGGLGIPSNLAGKEIPEYIEFKYIDKLMEHMDKITRMSRKVSVDQSYNAFRKKQDYVSKDPNVTVLTNHNNTINVDFISMDGIDGREHGIFSDLFGFADEYEEHKEYMKDGKFDRAKAVGVYKERWLKAFQLTLESHPTKIITIAVGAGAFDKTDQRYYTQASAEGFALALVENLEDGRSFLEHMVKTENAQFIFPFRDKGVGTYEIFKNALEKHIPGDLLRFFDFVNQPEVSHRPKI